MCSFGCAWLYIISIIFNIRITKGEYGLTSGTFKLYCLAVSFGVICNVIEFIIQYFDMDLNVKMSKLAGCIFVLWKIYSLKNSGEPDWDTGDEPEEPFSTTIGATLCIMVSYTFPTSAAIAFAITLAIVRNITGIEKYKLIRIVPVSILNMIEIIVGTILVRLAYKCSFFLAIILISLITLFFNIIISAVNDIILDLVTKGRFLQN